MKNCTTLILILFVLSGLALSQETEKEQRVRQLGEWLTENAQKLGIQVDANGIPIQTDLENKLSISRKALESAEDSALDKMIFDLASADNEQMQELVNFDRNSLKEAVDQGASRFRLATPFLFQLKKDRKNLYLPAKGADSEDVDGYKAHLEKAKPARFSWTRDFEDNETIWQAQGFLASAFRFNGKDANTGIWAVLGTKFDRVTGSFKDLNEINQLSFQGELILKRDLDLWTFDMSLAGVYTTDFDFDSEQIAVEFESGFEREFDFGGREKGDPRFTIRANVHFEFGDVLDAGGKASLMNQGQFARVGPRLEIILDTFPEDDIRDLLLRPSEREPFFQDFLKRLSFSASANHYEALTDDTENFTKFTAELGFRISQNLGLSINYEYGDMDRTGDEVHFLTIALTVKF